MTAALNTDASASPEFVVFYGVPWETYEGILDALGEYHLRHTYDSGTLEMRGLLGGVTWEDYLKLTDALAEYKLRHTYDRGTLEMMAPRKDHEWVAELLGRMVESMALAIDVPIQSVGSTTLSAARAECGLQPDKSYYVAHEPQVRGKDHYDPAKDPPPDLVIEVDVTSCSVPRLPVFARIGVPEVWRHDGEQMRFYRLGRTGRYKEAQRSLAFAFIASGDITRFLNRRHDETEHSVVRAFVEWATRARETASGPERHERKPPPLSRKRERGGLQP